MQFFLKFGSEIKLTELFNKKLKIIENYSCKKSVLEWRFIFEYIIFLISLWPWWKDFSRDSRKLKALLQKKESLLSLS